MAIFTLTNITITLLSLYAAKRIYWELTTGSRLRSFARLHGCQPAKCVQAPLTNGLFFWWAQIRAIKEHRLLPYISSVFAQVGAHTRYYYVFNTHFFLTQDPENVKSVLATDFSAWSLGQDRINEMSSYLGYGIFVNEGAAWKHSRELLRPCFEKSQVADVDLLERHVQRLFELLPKDGREVDLQPLLHDLSMDVATELLFGKGTNALDREAGGEQARRFCEAFDYASNPFEREAFKKWGVVALFLPDRWNEAKKECVRTMQEFVERIITVYTSSPSTDVNPHDDTKPRYNFLFALLESTNNHATIRSELLNILLAGRDTVASLLSNVLWELPRHPTMLSTLHSEILSVAGDSSPSYADLKNMKYLRAVVNESQRLYPIVPMNSREALVDTVLPRGGGDDGMSPVMVPKGSCVGWNIYSMQRRKDVFGDDAEVFRPERWLEPGFRPGWAYVPFSGGPRVCIGQNFALTETMYVIARTVQEFDIIRRDEDEWQEKFSITCTGLNGCKIGLMPREK